jgi:pyrroloquinoline quinone biosynthesis protein B
LAVPGDLSIELFPVAGKAPLYQEARKADLAGTDDINCGVEIRSGTARLVYIPGAAALAAHVRNRIAKADAVLFDGTLFTDDEMIRSSTGEKTGRRMGHMPISGADGSLAALAGLSNRRIYTHINNSNPVLIDGSPERRAVQASPATEWRSCCEGAAYA